MNYNETMELINEIFANFINKDSSEEYYQGAVDFKIILEDRFTDRWFNRCCKTCGAKFYISEEEIKWLEERKLKPFTHCSSCRTQRRNRVEHSVERELKKTFKGE